MSVTGSMLVADGVAKHYWTRSGGRASWGWSRRRRFSALADIDLRIDAGASIGLVGESGSGKTTLGRIIAGMLRADQGQLLWEGRTIDGLDEFARMTFRRAVQYVFQNPSDALNPRQRVWRILDWTLRGLTRLDTRARQERIADLSARVGIDPALMNRFPHQLSGGQAQRVAVARALLGEPKLVILDEPVSALDVSLQAQLLNLLAELRAEHNLAYLFISHDLAVVERLCDHIVVMRDGRIVERGPRDAILKTPGDEYTRTLLAAVPKL
jgi:peptide/nickel transport system ATP-binding protein